MSAGRTAVVVTVLALASAAAVAVASRAPASLRNEPAPADAADPSLGARFSERDKARSAAYSRPSYLAFALSFVVEVALLVMLASGPFRRLVATVERWPGGLPVQACVVAAAVTILAAAALLPLSFVRGYAIERAWGLSTQDAWAWLSDQARALFVDVIVAAAAAMAFFAVVRAARTMWWLWAWAVLTALMVVMTFLWPVVVAPLFNRFTPLANEALGRQVQALADEVRVDIDEVLVADASKRTTAENAYVAGLGSSKRLVLYDTLVEGGDHDATLFVVAHELGHRAKRHIAKGLVISSTGLFVGLALVAWLASRTALVERAGASSLSDLRVLPALLLVAMLAGLLTLPIQNAVSRRFEAEADRFSVALTGDRAAAVGAFRRLALSNLADLDPPRSVVWTLFSHPPIPERIRSVLDQ